MQSGKETAPLSNGEIDPELPLVLGGLSPNFKKLPSMIHNTIQSGKEDKTSSESDVGASRTCVHSFAKFLIIVFIIVVAFLIYKVAIFELHHGNKSSPPTLMPTSSAPTAFPTTIDTVITEIALSGFSCDEFGDTEALVFVTAVAESVEEIQDEIIGDTTCLDVAGDGRRMQLLDASDSVIITFVVTVSHSASYTVSSLFDDVIESGALDDAIEVAATENRVSVMSSVHVTSVTVTDINPTSLPTLMPSTHLPSVLSTAAPTTSPVPAPTDLVAYSYSYSHSYQASYEYNPCPCEDKGEEFCNFDFGDTGFCESCPEDYVDQCYSDGLPDDGADDCALKCFGTSAPLPAPTAAPISRPTTLPTSYPSVLPTFHPSALPTSHTSAAVPTSRPTTLPTSHPSVLPTFHPAPLPTESPSDIIQQDSCEDWCATAEAGWADKCSWGGCVDCDECGAPTTAPTMTLPTPAPTIPAACSGFTESWRDDFDTFDTQSWSRGLVYDQDPENIHMTWNSQTGCANLLNNKYAGWIRDEDSYVENGSLFLRNTDTSVNGTTGEGDLTFNYTTGWINSMEKKYWNGAAKSSYLDIRAKFPSGPKNWPAIWMVENGEDGVRSWPPEIDIWEYFGVFFNPSWGCIDCMYMRNIYGENYAVAEDHSLIINDFMTAEYPTADTEFHQYGWLWTNSTQVWYIDGSEVARMDKGVDVSEEDWPTVNMCLVMNNGLLSSISTSKYPELEETTFPNYVVIDSLALYEEPDEDAE